MHTINSVVLAVQYWVLLLLLLLPLQSMVSEQPERFFVSEIIREQIFLQYDKEIPYCSQVGLTNLQCHIILCQLHQGNVNLQKSTGCRTSCCLVGPILQVQDNSFLQYTDSFCVELPTYCNRLQPNQCVEQVLAHGLI